MGLFTKEVLTADGVKYRIRGEVKNLTKFAEVTHEFHGVMMVPMNAMEFVNACTQHGIWVKPVGLAADVGARLAEHLRSEHWFEGLVVVQAAAEVRSHHTRWICYTIDSALQSGTMPPSVEGAYRALFDKMRCKKRLENAWRGRW